MKIWCITVISCMSFVVLDAATGQISVRNSNKAITVQLQNENGTPLKDQNYQTIYTIQPNGVRSIPVPQIGGTYRLKISFPDLVGYAGYIFYPGLSAPALRVTTNNQSVTVPDQTKNYNDFAAQKKAQETPEPPVYGGDW